MNRYSYGLNNPVRYVDPTGHMACGDECDPGGGGGDPIGDPCWTYGGAYCEISPEEKPKEPTDPCVIDPSDMQCNRYPRKEKETPGTKKPEPVLPTTTPTAQGPTVVPAPTRKPTTPVPYYAGIWPDFEKVDGASVNRDVIGIAGGFGPEIIAAGVVTGQPELVVGGAFLYGAGAKAASDSIQDIRFKVSTGEMSEHDGTILATANVISALPLGNISTGVGVGLLINDLAPAFQPPTRFVLIQ